MLFLSISAFLQIIIYTSFKLAYLFQFFLQVFSLKNTIIFQSEDFFSNKPVFIILYIELEWDLHFFFFCKSHYNFGYFSNYISVAIFPLNFNLFQCIPILFTFKKFFNTFLFYCFQIFNMCFSVIYF